MTNSLNDLIPLIINAYTTTYPFLIDDSYTPAMRASRDQFDDDCADAITACSTILADSIRYSSDSMIDTANAMLATITALHAIAYCDDLTTDDLTALRTHLNADLIRDLHNINADDTAIRYAAFFAPIFTALPDDDDELLDLMMNFD